MTWYPRMLTVRQWATILPSRIQQFSEEYAFKHMVMNSPNCLQANGKAEGAIRTVETLLYKNEDPLMALMVHQSTP